MTKKIIIVYSGAKHQGGIERYLENLFAFYDKKKTELILVSLGEWPLCKQIEGMGGKVIVLSKGRVSPQNILKISNIVSEEKASLIVSQGVVANAYARSVAFLAKIPHLTTVHSDFDLDYSNPLIRTLYNTSDKVSRWRTDKYIAVSKHLKDRLIQSGIKEDKISVIYNGVSLQDTRLRNKAADGQARDKTQGTKKMGGEVVIGSIGRLHKVKGYDNLIKAFSQINSIGIKMIIWGEGAERKNLEGLIQELNLKNKVELAGFTDDIESALYLTDIYIQPSISEGFGLTVVEAMLAGKPVIVTPAGSLKEIIKDEENGLVTKDFSAESLANALEKALKNPNLLQKLSVNAKKSAEERFSTEKWISETEKVYMETGNE